MSDHTYIIGERKEDGMHEFIKCHVNPNLLIILGIYSYVAISKIIHSCGITSNTG